MNDPLISALLAHLPTDRVLAARADRLQWAGDASIYHLVPRVVVMPRTAAEIQALLSVARAQRVGVCFRAGGTSLSGQAVTDGILVVLSAHFREITVLNDGAHVRCGPGAVGAWVNAALAPHGRKIGPDPASIQAAEIGGIVANNASGMCCGIHHNSYRTVTGLDLILADGWRLDTGADDADAKLRTERSALHAGLLALRADLLADADLTARVARAFSTKNTVGYSLNALLDASTAAEILQKLVVGSEGTLACIAAATFATVPLPKHRATAWMVYPDVLTACAAVPELTRAGAAAIELLDAVALQRVAEKLPEPMPPGEPAALLIEFQEEDAFTLGDRIHALPFASHFTTDPVLQARYWAIRKGLFPSVGAIRAAGTAVVIEDVTFPVARLAEGVSALRSLFIAHGYPDAVIFGHAKDGNLHFTLTPDLAQPAEVARYAQFMDALAACVLERDGHLKAEHGTGRNMAPYVTAQWGEPAVALMRRIKTLLDPLGILNPGVLLSDDPRAHLQHLKVLPPVQAAVDRCIECGFCEPVCPSRDFATSPRQRIALLRAVARGEAVPDWTTRAVDSCAGDGLCATACPVGIDTGAVMRAERAARRGPLARRIAGWTARHVAVVTAVNRFAVRVAGILPERRLPGRSIPLPSAATRPAAALAGDPVWLYFPTCLARMFGDLPADLRTLCQAAGVGLVLPPEASALCCGQPFASKGFPAAETEARERTLAALREAAGGAAIAGIVTDAATCAAHLAADLKVLDPATFAAEVLVPRLRLAPVEGPLWLHPTCADQKQGWGAALQRAVPAGKIPASLGCCGMAGDKGWTTPGLTAAATARERAETGGGCGVSTGATCAAAMGHEHLWRHLAARLL
jgi:D-lactate dehydrogenase